MAILATPTTSRLGRMLSAALSLPSGRSPPSTLDHHLLTRSARDTVAAAAQWDTS